MQRKYHRHADILFYRFFQSIEKSFFVRRDAKEGVYWRIGKWEKVEDGWFFGIAFRVFDLEENGRWF